MPLPVFATEVYICKIIEEDYVCSLVSEKEKPEPFVIETKAEESEFIPLLFGQD